MNLSARCTCEFSSSMTSTASLILAQVTGCAVGKAPVWLSRETEGGESVRREVRILPECGPNHPHLLLPDPLVLANLILQVMPLFKAIQPRLSVPPHQVLRLNDWDEGPEYGCRDGP